MAWALLVTPPLTQHRTRAYRRMNDLPAIVRAHALALAVSTEKGAGLSSSRPMLWPQIVW